MPDPQTGVQKTSGILEALSQILPGIGGMFGGGGGGGRQASPLVSPGLIGQVPQAPPVPQVAGGGTGGGGGAMPMPGRMAAPVGPASQVNTGTQPAPRSGAYSSGFEFATPQGRNAAVVTNAIQGVTDFLTQAKQKKEAKTTKQAENYLTQIHNAQQSGDQETLNLLLQDPKVISTLEKGLDYFMPKVPGEPAPPEAKGMHAAIKKLFGREQQQKGPLPAPNTPGGVAIARQPQSASNAQAMADLTSKAALQAMQGDPGLARQAGLGTSLTGQEMRDAERYQAGLALAPADERRAVLASQSALDKFDQENKMLLAELASRERIASQGLTSAERQAHISAGPMYYRAQIAKDIADSQIKIKQMVANGKAGEANRYAMTTITSQINNLRTNAEKSKKDGNDDMAAEFLKQADDLQKTYDQLQKANELNIDQLIKDILE